eukprot:507414-Prymnesium_polylepis.1
MVCIEAEQEIRRRRTRTQHERGVRHALEGVLPQVARVDPQRGDVRRLADDTELPLAVRAHFQSLGHLSISIPKETACASASLLSLVSAAASIARRTPSATASWPSAERWCQSAVKNRVDPVAG